MPTIDNLDVKPLKALSQLLRSPLILPEIGEWRKRVLEDFCYVLQADHTTLMMPVPGLMPIESRGVDQSATDAYLSHFMAIDHGRHRARALGLPVTTQRMLYGEGLERTELFNDFFIPYDLVGGVALTIHSAAGEAAWIGVGGAAVRRQDQRAVGIMNMLVSDFEAGVQIAQHFGAVRSDLLTLCDSLPSKLAICDARGSILHVNEALQALMNGMDENIIRDAVRQAVVSLVSGQASDGDRAKDLRTTASWVGPRDLGAGGLVVVLVEGRDLDALAARRLVQDRGLTARETDVALLIASGKSNKAIAAALRLSSHTVKRHTERVLNKLGVKRRAAVAATVGAVYRT
jgi:DNA-binding CsgD family transcriptional regulator